MMNLQIKTKLFEDELSIDSKMDQDELDGYGTLSVTLQNTEEPEDIETTLITLSYCIFDHHIRVFIEDSKNTEFEVKRDCHTPVELTVTMSTISHYIKGLAL